MKSRMYVPRAILGLLVCSLPLFSQAQFGRILGTVTDQTGAVLPGATVTVTDTQRGVARTLTTDAAGEYNAPTLIPSTYTIRVEAKGFKTLERESVVLEVGKEVRVDLTPQPGEQTQTVTVTEAIPLVDTASATLGGTLSNSDINDMPLNGRNYQNLMNLRPGVVVQPGGGPWTQSTNNVRPDESGWMVDGIINSSFFDARPVVNFPSPLSDMSTILPIDAIQEFNLEENPKAEFGWKPGAVVNVGIRSGTNAYHGSAYAFGRNGSWDARDIFNPAPNPLLPVQLEQFGGVVGGPIKKDKLFFFGGYEGLRSLVGNLFSEMGPETAPGAGPAKSMVDAIAALQTAGVPVSPVSLKLLGCTTGAAISCTGGIWSGLSPNTTLYNSTFPTTNTSDNGVGKIDYTINTKHRLSGMVWIGNYLGDGNDHGFYNSLFNLQALVRATNIVVNEIWTPSSRLVNEFRVGYDRYTFTSNIDDGGFMANGKGGLCTATGCGGSYPINTGVTATGGLPNINITGYGAPGLGAGHNRPSSVGPSPFFDFQDSVSYLLGKHSFKFGAEYAHIEVDTLTEDTERGRLDFLGNNTPLIPGSTPLEDFFAGNPSRGFLLVGNPIRQMNWHSLAGFVQDDWRIAPRLMVNLGMRYSYFSPIEEANNLWGNFSPTLGMVQQGQPGVGPSIYKPDYGNWSPRAGFAWDVTGKGTTVVRGGASLIYSSYKAGMFTSQIGIPDISSTTVSGVPTGACKTVVAVGTPCPQAFGGNIQLASVRIPGSKLNWGGVVFPSGAGVSCTAAGPCSLLSVDPNLQTPYIVNYNLGVQHAFTNNLSLELGYVGTHGGNLIGLRDLNQCPPNPTGACATANRPFAAQFPYLSFINYINNYGYSNFNSLQATLTQRFSHGLNFTAGYTYGHGLDNASLNTQYGYMAQNANNTSAEYASGDFDIRHRFTLTASYAIPGKKGFGQLLEGWKINSILTLQSGQPWSVDDRQNSFSGSGDFADRWDFFGSPGDFGSGTQSIPHCSGFVPGQGLGGVTCESQSGVSGIVAQLPSSLANACLAKAPDMNTLATGGCYVKGNSVMVPPATGTFGTMGRNIFRDSGFKNLDFSLFKDFKFKERYNAQFRIEFFNVFNHPNIANPFGSVNNYGGGSDPGSNPTTFGCGCTTPDIAAGNPIVGSGSSRDIQLGFKFTF